MKAFFLGRALREKILLLTFTLLVLLIWVGRGLGRSGSRFGSSRSFGRGSLLPTTAARRQSQSEHRQ